MDDTEQLRGSDLRVFLFTDIEEYSCLPPLLQLAAAERLKHETEHALAATATTDVLLLVLPTGDGLILVFPAECAGQIIEVAVELHRSLACRPVDVQPVLKLRTGLHVGEVFGYTDMNGQQNIAGTGVNEAQRIMSFGDGDHILCSGVFRQVCIHRRPETETLFARVGERFDKHGYSYDVWNIVSSDVGNPAVPERGLSNPDLTRTKARINKTVIKTRSTESSPEPSFLQLGADTAARWGHSYIGPEHVFAGLARVRSTALLKLSNRTGVRTRLLMALVRDLASTGRIDVTWRGMPLSPSIRFVADTSRTGLAEEVIANILRLPLSLPGLALRELVATLDLAAVAFELWPDENPVSLPTDGGSRLYICNGPEDGRTIPLIGEVGIGRGEEQECALPYDPELSRMHARVLQGSDGNWLVADIGSTNGTSVNSQPISSATALAHGDVISVGNVGLLFLSA